MGQNRIKNIQIQCAYCYLLSAHHICMNYAKESSVYLHGFKLFTISHTHSQTIKLLGDLKKNFVFLE